MSFRLFIYYCALCGGCTAFVGWVMGRVLATGDPLLLAGVKGMLLGMVLAFGLGLVDALWNFALTRVLSIAARVLVAVVVGAMGGLFGGLIGQLFYAPLDARGFGVLAGAFLIFGWTITGLLIGSSLGVFDLLVRLLRAEDFGGALRKIINGVLGGTLGGLLGGVLFLLLKGAWTSIFSNKPADELWSPSATGFVALGLCIGLLIGLAQVILKEAWVKVEAGFRAGRELILSKAETTIGRAESCDIGLFGDAKIERTHARILLQGGRYLLVDAGSPGGTYLNGARVVQPTPLRSGDMIGVGQSSLRFGERRKRA